jgi:hypothetical protein
VSSPTIDLGERSCQKLAGNEVAHETAQDFSMIPEDTSGMCLVTGSGTVVRPHPCCPPSDGGRGATSKVLLPPKSAIPKSVIPSPKKKAVSFVPSQVSRKSKKDDVEHPSEPDVLTIVHEGALPPASSMSPSEKAVFWWQQNDYHIFSGTARLVAGEIRRRAASMSAAAARSASAYHGGRDGSTSSNTETHAESYVTVLTQVLQACSLAAAPTAIVTITPGDGEDDVKAHPLNSSLFAHLAHWTRSSHSRRGLERWSVAYHGSKRIADREAQIRAVLIAQAEPLQDEDKDDKIKAASEACSRAARLFALTIGQADAAAVVASCPS